MLFKLASAVKFPNLQKNVWIFVTLGVLLEKSKIETFQKWEVFYLQRSSRHVPPQNPDALNRRAGSIPALSTSRKIELKPSRNRRFLFTAPWPTRPAPEAGCPNRHAGSIPALSTSRKIEN